jgi:hypothetical protein
MIESTTLDALYLENSGCFDSIQIDGEYINMKIFESMGSATLVFILVYEPARG